MKEGDIILLENLRFHPGEDKNDAEFAKQLAALCDIYIDDAFAVSHRAAASNSAITEFVKICAAGFLLKNEVEYFKKAMVNPAQAIWSRLSAERRFPIKSVFWKILSKKWIKFIIGGGMAFTFLRAAGYEIGKSLVRRRHAGSGAQRLWKKPNKKMCSFYCR